MKFLSYITIIQFFNFLAFCSNNYRNILTMDNGLIIENMEIGDGTEAQDYNKVVVNYTGKLEDGSIFDSSLNPGRGPFTFTLGVGSVIKGWDIGVKGMKVGGREEINGSARSRDYGNNGAGNVIPPGATLIFDG